MSKLSMTGSVTITI